MGPQARPLGANPDPALVASCKKQANTGCPSSGDLAWRSVKGRDTLGLSQEEVKVKATAWQSCSWACGPHLPLLYSVILGQEKHGKKSEGTRFQPQSYPYWLWGWWHVAGPGTQSPVVSMAGWHTGGEFSRKANLHVGISTVFLFAAWLLFAHSLSPSSL